MDMPPSRYKVVEEGRRLIVIDRMTGERVQRQLPPPSRARSPARPARDDQSTPPRPRQAPAGATTITTQRWFDDKGPRTIAITGDASMMLAVSAVVVLIALLFVFAWASFFGLFAVAFLAFHIGRAGAFRRGVTVWLDTLELA